MSWKSICLGQRIKHEVYSADFGLPMFIKLTIHLLHYEWETEVLAQHA